MACGLGDWRLLARAWTISKQVPEPAVRAGTVRVQVDAAPLLSYLRAYTAGELTTYQPPDGEFTPGANGIGVIDEVSELPEAMNAAERPAAPLIVMTAT
jgi:NADPH:quinone reductase-like Zn-dependent oxidoreductase